MKEYYIESNRGEEVLHTGIKKKKVGNANLMGFLLYRNYLLKHFIAGKIEREKLEKMRRKT